MALLGGSNRGLEYSFGAVYEHCDLTGKPMLVGATTDAPERQFSRDRAGSTAVARLLSDSTAGQGQSRTVWAAVGRASAGLGKAEMREVSDAVATARAARLKVSSANDC